MALTLSEAEKFTTNMVKRGVLKEVIKDSVVLQKLPFIDVVGNAYQYLRENSLGTGSFYDPNETWTEQTPTFTQVTAVIKILGGDADIDEFLKATRSDKTDLESESIAAKAKGIKNTFLDRFYYGDNATNTKEFNGLHKLITTGQTVNQGSGSTGAALSLVNLDTMLDKILDGRPDALLMTRNIRRRISQYVRANGGLYQAEFNEFGQLIKKYNDVSVHIDDLLTQTETIASGAYSAKTGGATSTLFAVRFGTNDMAGLQNGSLSIKKIGQVQNKDAERWRIKWYVGLALLRTIALAGVDGVTDVAVVA